MLGPLVSALNLAYYGECGRAEKAGALADSFR